MSATRFYSFVIAVLFLLVLQKHLKVSAQSLDSLQKVVSSSASDSVKVKTYYQLSEICNEDEIEGYVSKLFYYLNAGVKNKTITNTLFINEYTIKGRINRAYFYNSKGNIHSAIQEYYLAMKLAEKSGALSELSSIYNNLSLIYKRLNDTEKAIDFIQRSIEIRKKLNFEPSALAISYGNLAMLYYSQEDSVKGLYYDQKAVELNLISGQPNAQSLAFIKKGDWEKRKQNYLLARDYYLKSYEIHHKGSDDRFLAYDFINLAEIERLLGNYQEAYSCSDKALKLAQKHYFPDVMEIAYKELYSVQEKTGKHKEALDAFKRMVHLRDSLKDNTFKEQAVAAGLKYQFEKVKDHLNTVQSRKLQEEQQKRERVRMFLFFSLFVLLLAIVLSVFIYKRWQLSQFQNKVIEEQRQSIKLQHELLENKSKAIEDSINYASAIQNSFLIPRGKVNQITGREIMLFYKPKDIVSGDFYWFKKIDSRLFFVVADSTGHGVPGAFISLISLKAIESTVEKFNSSVSAEIILDRLDKELQIISEVDAYTKAGVDLVVACLDSITNTLTVTGSRNSFYLVREGEIKETKFNNLYLGSKEKNNELPQNFTVQVNKGDVLYFSTDGFPDQKGGSKGAKYFLKPFRDLLIKISNQPVKQQRLSLEAEFNSWKGSYQQTDDVLVVAIKV